MVCEQILPGWPEILATRPIARNEWDPGARDPIELNETQGTVKELKIQRPQNILLTMVWQFRIPPRDQRFHGSHHVVFGCHIRRFEPWFLCIC